MTAPSTRPTATARRYRLLGVSATGVLAVLVGMLLFGNLTGNLVYYLQPGEALALRAEQSEGTRFQLGGLVVPDSVTSDPGLVRFDVAPTEGPADPLVTVEYSGAPAQLFGAGVGVVLEGSWQGDVFVSDSMKIKHDENYRPPDDGEWS